MSRPRSSPGVSLPRWVAWKVLQSVAAGAFADVALAREFRRHGNRLSAADRALTMELTYGSIRQRRLLDRWLDHCGAVPAQQQPPLLRWLLHLGLYQLLFGRHIPEAVAVSSSVELAKAHGMGAQPNLPPHQRTVEFSHLMESLRGGEGFRLHADEFHLHPLTGEQLQMAGWAPVSHEHQAPGRAELHRGFPPKNDTTTGCSEKAQVRIS